MSCRVFFSAHFAKIQISLLTPLLDDQSTLAIPVDTVAAECSSHTLEGRNYKGAKVAGFRFAPSCLRTFYL